MKKLKPLFKTLRVMRNSEKKTADVYGVHGELLRIREMQ